MNTKTEVKQEISQEPMAQQASGTDSNDQPARGHGGGLWILTVALVAFAGLAAALAIVAFDGSNGNNADVPAYEAPRLKPEFHHPGQLSSEAPVLREWDYNTYRVPAHSAPVAQEIDKDFQREANQAASAPSVGQEIDKDAQRETNQAASQEEVAPYGSGLPHEAH